MSEIKGFSSSIVKSDTHPKRKPATGGENAEGEDFNVSLQKNLENLKSIENKIDGLNLDSDTDSASSLDDGVKKAGGILKDIEGVWNELKKKGNPSS